MSLYKQQRAQIKEQIFISSIELFKDKGYENISIDQITKHVGIAKGTFYNFFDSKKDILILWAEQEFQKFDFKSTVNPDNSIEDNLHELIRFLVGAIKESAPLFKAFLNELVKISSPKQEADSRFDFLSIFTFIVKNSSDYSIIGEAYFDEKMSVLNNSLFMSLINWFKNESSEVGLDIHMMNIVKVCLHGIMKNWEVRI